MLYPSAIVKSRPNSVIAADLMPILDPVQDNNVVDLGTFSFIYI